MHFHSLTKQLTCSSLTKSSSLCVHHPVNSVCSHISILICSFIIGSPNCSLSHCLLNYPLVQSPSALFSVCLLVLIRCALSWAVTPSLGAHISASSLMLHWYVMASVSWACCCKGFRHGMELTTSWAARTWAEVSKWRAQWSLNRQMSWAASQ